MASEIYRFEALNQSSSDSSISITVPADAQAIIVCGTGYSNDGDPRLYSALNFDDTTSADFTKILVQRYSATFTGATIECWIMTSTDGNWPGTGAATLYFDGVGFSEGFNTYVFYAKGLSDLSSPIVDTDGTDDATSYTGSLTGVTSNDLSVVVAYHFRNTPDVNPSGSGQTAQIESGSFNNAGFGLGYKLGESAMQAEGVDNTLTAASFSLKGVGASSIIPVIMNHLKNQGIS